MGGRLWVSDRDPALHIFDAETGDHIRSLGPRGDEPGQFGGLPFGQSVVPPGGDALWVWDRSLQRLTRFGGTPGTERYQEIIELSDEPVDRTTWLDPDHILGITGEGDRRFVIFGRDGGPQRTVGASPPGSDSITLEERRKAWNTGISTCTAGDGTGFVVVYHDFGRIERYDGSANQLGLADVPYPSDPAFQAVDRPDLPSLAFVAQRRAYRGCVITTNRIFALYSGRHRDAYPPAEFFNAASFVHVFDRDGGFLGVLELDRAATDIVVDPSGARLLTVSVNDARVSTYVLPTTPR